jgi:tRNA dimethylallyltransferase
VKTDDSVYLTGPTASGKSRIGVELAKLLGAEVVALDSMTLYRGMDIGTAKPAIEERGGIPHHLLDVLDPSEGSSVAWYLEQARRVVEEIRSRGRRALFVGGTPLYLKALLRGLFVGPAADQEVRDRLMAEAIDVGGTSLHERLSRIDPAAASRIHPNDQRRLVRAMEVHELTGRPLSEFQTQHENRVLGVPAVYLRVPRPSLHERIDRRTESMFLGGLVEETRRLLERERPLHPVPAQAAGYRESIGLLAGKCDQPTAIHRTQARTRQLAKRQETWFRGLAELEPFDVSPHESPEIVARRLNSWLVGRGECHARGGELGEGD